ncbi:hypothetical protein [Terriglobus saanensis]|nr:hypothetical protein [Terriglobus saanensis]
MASLVGSPIEASAEPLIDPVDESHRWIEAAELWLLAEGADGVSG